MKIGFVTFGKSWNTMGLEIVCSEIERNFDIKPIKAEIKTAKTFDVLLFSLFWWEHKYDYIRFIHNSGLKPHTKKPYLVLGGMEMLSPKSLSGFFDYAVIGDGEDIITELMQNIIDKKEPRHRSIWIDGRKNKCVIHKKSVLYAKTYIESRTNKLTRVEIARGCKKKCSFCMISFVKPYRELPSPVVKQLIINSPTNRIALFAPDTASYKDYDQIEYWIRKYKKTNMGTDLRLDNMVGRETASALRFGIEGFTEKARRAIGKNYSNNDLIKQFDYMMNKLQKTKGGNLTTATAYMILGLPGEYECDYSEFNNVLKKISKKVKDKFTLFLTLNGFSPQNFTPLQFAGIKPFISYTKKWNNVRERFSKLVIAQHGGSRNPSNQIMQMLTIRGDEKAAKILYNLAINPTVKKKAIGGAHVHGKYLLRMLKDNGIDPNKIIGELNDKDILAWDDIENPNFTKEKLYKMYSIYKRKVA